MCKKICKCSVAMLCCLMLIIMDLVPASAIEGSFDENTDEINYLTKDILIERFFSSSFDFESYYEFHLDYIEKLRERVNEYNDESQVFYFWAYNHRYKSNLYLYRTAVSVDNIVYDSTNDYKYDSAELLSYQLNEQKFISGYKDDVLIRFNAVRYVDLATCLAVNDYDYYLYLRSEYSDYKEKIYYYDNNILKLFLDVFDSFRDFYDVDDIDTSSTYIKYYSWLDSYKATYNERYYADDDIRNYLNSSVVFDDTVNVYYSSDVDDVETTEHYQHKEDVTFYVDFKDETIKNNLTALSSKSDVMNLMNACTTVKHYTKNIISFQSWFDSLNINYYINKNHQFQFTMSNSYTYMSKLMQGFRVDTNAKLLNSNEKIFDGFGGLTDNLGNKSDLRNKGWSHGYPNTSNYSYRIDIYKDAKKYLQIYFKNKPKTTAHYYTDSQIKYTLDLTSNVGYFYSVDYNLSKSFDFSEIENVDKDILVAILDKIILNKDIELSEVQQYINETYVSRGVLDSFNSQVAIVYNLAKVYLDLDNDIYDINTRTLVIWTNYTGTLDRENWVGYHCRFNWDIDTDGSLSRSNSDDTHNYHEDVVKDILSDTEIATEVSTTVDANGNIISSYNTTYNYYNYYYTDNNNNWHGGADSTYIATEQPTASQLAYENISSDFDFNANTLWNYASSAMSFCKNAFSVLPGWIWLLVASGITLTIILRILGR